MKKNLIFKLCFIVASFLIILTACDLGTNNRIKRANITFSLEGPAIEQARANSRASSSARYIHPYASSLKFELFSGKELLDSQTISIQSGTKSISITVKGVPLNDPNLRAEIEVYKNQEPVAGNVLVGYRDYTIGSIGQNTTLTIGIIPKVEENAKALFVEKEEEEGDIYIELDTLNPNGSFFVWEIKMLSQKGLYTIEAYESRPELYASDGRQYKNTFLIPGGDGTTLVFYHPKDEPSTYYLASSSNTQFSINYGTKLEQEILVTQYDENDKYDKILGNPGEVDFREISSDDSPKTHSFTIYNPYPFTLNLEYTIDNADEVLYPDSKDKFKFTDFPEVLLPGKSKEFTVNFHDPDFDSTTYSVKSTISAPGLKDFVLHFTGSTSGI